MDGLTEGRIVHYVAQSGRHLAAIVTGLNPDYPDVVNLAVFVDTIADDSGSALIQHEFNVHYSATPQYDTWHWPERVPQEQSGK